MAKKQDAYYFETFEKCVNHGCKAANILYTTLSEFDPDNIKQRLDEIHAEEHAADTEKHELLNTLVKAFITPIDREDIILLSQNIDEMVDKIDDVLQRVYCNNVLSIRPDALKLAALLVRCCTEVADLMKEFANFKHSKAMHTHIININSLEEEADKLYSSCVRTLHTTSKDPMEVFAWHELYSYLEKCMDACEHVADTVESIVMKNS